MSKVDIGKVKSPKQTYQVIWGDGAVAQVAIGGAVAQVAIGGAVC